MDNVKSGGDVEDYKSFREAMRKTQIAAIDEAMKYADELAGVMIEKLQEDLAGFKVPKPRVLEVKLTGKDKVKLSKQASPYLELALKCVSADVNILLVGPAGAGKSIIAEQVAEALTLPFSHINCTAGASESWFFGRQTPNGFIPGAFHTAYKDGHVFAGEELDAADENMLLAINTALANGHMYNPINGESVKRHKNFVFIGNANTCGKGADAVYTGRNRLDGATLNRFFVISVDYDAEIEKQVCPHVALRDKFQAARSELRKRKAEEIISTRSLAMAYALHQAGVSDKDLLAGFTFGWPETLAKNCGMEGVLGDAG
jgi:MoxR-like ATPase